MKPDFILDSLEYIDADLIEAAGDPVRRQGGIWVKWAAAAACLCLIAGGLFALRSHKDPAQAGIGHPASFGIVLEWSEQMTAGDYFTYNGDTSRGNAASLVMPPYAAAVPLNGERTLLEADGVLPELPDHPEHSFQAEFNGDGSFYKVWFLWMRRSESNLDGYSDLKLTAAPREIHEVSDTTSVEVDENGNVSVPSVTVTQRDGVYIVAEGVETSKKTLTWQTEQGWYQLSGSWNDSYADLVSLLDWFWTHPLDLARFAALGEEALCFSTRAEHPEAFTGRIPDFAILGYEAETELVNLAMRDGALAPVWFDGTYVRGETRIRWTVSAGADRDAWDICLGRPGEITAEKVTAAMETKNYFTIFFDHPYLATLRIEQGTPAEAWEIVQSMQGAF